MILASCCDSVPEASMPGMTEEMTDGDEYQDTVPFDDIIIADSPLSETELESIHVDTEVLDIDIDKEVVLDSDDEEIQRNEALCLTNKLPSGKIDTSLEGGKGITGKKQLRPATNQSYVGYFRRRGSKIQCCSIFKGSDTGPESIYAEATWKKQHNIKGNENGGESQAAMNGNVKDGAVGNRNRDCDGKIASSVDDRRNNDVDMNISKADVQAEMEVPVSNCEAADGRKATLLITDHDHSTLSYIDSQEPGEHSQANALSVVDHYLSGIDVSLSPDVERGKVTRMVSAPTSFGKGSQALARQANLRNTHGEFGRFDWSGNKAEDSPGFHVKKRKEGFSGRKDDRQEPVSPFQHFSNLKFQKDIDFGRKKLQMTIANNEHKDSTEMAVNIDETSEMLQATELKSDTNLANQLDKKVDLESFEQLQEMDVIDRHERDLFDIGFDTQLAAEAMEALMFVSPPSMNISSLPTMQNLPEDPSRGEMLNGALKCSAFRMGNGSEVISKNTKRTVRSLEKSKKINFSPSEIEANEKKFGPKLTRRKNLTSQIFPVRGNKIKKPGSSKSAKRDSHVVKRRGKVNGSSPFTPSTRQALSVSSKQNVEGPLCDSRERLNLNCIVKEVDCLAGGTKRRKLDSVDLKAVGLKNKLPKTNSNTHCGATNCNVKKQMPTDSSVAVTNSHLKLDTWTYPKRKRTHPKVLNHLRKASNHLASSEAVHANNGITQSFEIPQKSEANLGANHFILQAVRKPRSICQVQPLSEKKSVEAFSRDDSVAEYAHGGAGVGNQLIKKISSRSPLMKELSRLGFSESLPDFVSKDLRRRRNMANVQVLFSQGLNDDIREKQTKILARLGISVASCCSEATHFITNKFVRTRNMLEAIALGKPVVTPLWLENCAEAACLVDEEKYILRDTEKEKEIGFDLSTSLTRARHHPLLKDQRVLITQNVKPCKEMIESLVKSVNGQPVENILVAARDKFIREDLLILSCEEDYTTCVPFLEKGVHVFNSELLLSGIVTQKLEYLRVGTLPGLNPPNSSTSMAIGLRWNVSP
ncbi:hypothetical protein AgCh_032964 [Apium graveolens]